MEEQREDGDPVVLQIPSLKFAPKFGVDNKKRQLTTDPVASFESNVVVQWGEKKQKLLTTWLNKVLTPPIEMDNSDDNARQRLADPNEIVAVMKKVAAGEEVRANVPTKEEASLQVYVSRRWMNKLRLQASNVYAALEPLLTRIDEAVDNRKIAVRKDKHIYNDVGLQKFFLKLLLSVHPIWLRVGLETIYGALITQIKSNKDVYGLTCFVMERMFNDPDLRKAYGFATVINYYKEEYATEIGKFFIKKFLRLFIFLDRAKTARMIKHDPCLFYSKSEYKSTKDVLAAMTTEIISGDGNLFKLLAQIGCRIDYEQTYVDEVRYCVQNLKQDLRDGVILCRIVELLTDDYSLMSKLRCPPISLLQKTHNVGVALMALAAKGVQVNDIQSKKIVEGHREKTMVLIDRIMQRFYNIKIGDGGAQLAETFTRFQACCKGFLFRRMFKNAQEEEDKEDGRHDEVRLSSSTMKGDMSVSSSGISENGRHPPDALPFIFITTPGGRAATAGRDQTSSSIVTSCSSSVSSFSSSSHSMPNDIADATVGVFDGQSPKQRTDSPISASFSEAAAEDESRLELSVSGIRTSDEDWLETATRNGCLQVLDQPTTNEVNCTFTAATSTDSTFTVAAAAAKGNAAQDGAALENPEIHRADVHACQSTIDKYVENTEEQRDGLHLAKNLEPDDIPTSQLDDTDTDYEALLGGHQRSKNLLDNQCDTANGGALMTVSDQQAMDRIDSILNNAGCKDDIAALDKSEKVEERRRDEAAWRIQTWWRHVSSLRRSEKKEQELTQELVRRTDAASMIQAWWKRLMLARRLEKIAREIALEIWLKQIVIEIERQERDRKVQAANVIVLWWKRCLQKRRLDELERRRQAAAANSIACWWKSILIRREARKAVIEELRIRSLAAIKIQAVWRGFKLRSDLEKQKAAVIKELRMRSLTATRIQAAWKGFAVRRALEKQRKAAQLIAVWWKRLLVRREARKAVIEELRARSVAASKIQAFWKGFALRRELEKRRIAAAEEARKSSAAVIIQAAWRGYQFRRNPSNFPAVVEQVRQRIAAANADATEDRTVAVRTRNGLRYLLERESLESIRIGLQELDVVARLSATSCNDIVDQGGVQVLFELIRHMNHSVASQIITKLAVSVLFSIAKFDHTRAAICAVTHWFDGLIKLLQEFKASGDEIVFKNTAMILVIMFSVDEAKAEIETNKIAIRKLRTVHLDLDRQEKHRKEEEKRKLLQQYGKTELKLRQLGIHPPAPFWTNTVVRFTPDWILTRDKPNENLSRYEAVAWVAHAYKDRLSKV